MKVTKEDLKTMKKIIEEFFAASSFDIDTTRALYKSKKMSDTRFRFDILYAAVATTRSTVIKDIYKYANDTHINTALKTILKPKKG
ncbi:MAG: hypothetical protein JRC90_12285 [Deltaproteobacteria bacterium]|nr:hypothetical protein [Deltaproteobacteria bacterium]